jgi:hypothetical protein
MLAHLIKNAPYKGGDSRVTHGVTGKTEFVTTCKPWYDRQEQKKPNEAFPLVCCCLVQRANRLSTEAW